MTDLQYIYRIFFPSASARLSGQAAARDLHSIRRTLHFRVRSKARLTPVEQHLINSFPQLQNKIFAPSIAAVSMNVAHAFIKPMLAFSAFALISSAYAPSLLGGVPEASVAFAEPDTEFTLAAENQPQEEAKLDLPQLALALAREHDVEELAPVETAGFALPEIPRPEVAGEVIGPQPEQSTMSFQDLEADAQLKQQRNLVRFISGIIAAFRPSIKDSGSIARHIVEMSGRENVDPIYVAAVIAIESRFSSTAESDAGALGLMQLMPTTAREVANSKSHRTAQLSDPKTNIKLGISYLKQLEGKFRGNRFLALAAYNWGPANIDRVHGRYRQIPGSVRKYSTTVLERTLAWRRHFDRATESADSLRTVSREDAASNS